MSQSIPEGQQGVRLRVEGVVQGVGFRWWTRDRAAELNLTGSVRNLPDESVEIVAFGTPHALSTLRRLVGQGPPSAVVEHVHESAVPETVVPPRDFRILH